MSNISDSNQDRHFVGPDLGPNCLQRLSADNKARSRVKQDFGGDHLGLDARKPVFGGFANNTGADQPAHPRSLVSAFVIPFLESIRCKLATDEISIF